MTLTFEVIGSDCLLRMVKAGIEECRLGIVLARACMFYFLAFIPSPPPRLGALILVIINKYNMFQALHRQEPICPGKD